MNARWRLPKTLLVGHDLVEIHLVDADTLRDMGADHDGEPLEGLWREDTLTVYVLKTLPPQRRNRVFWHEVQHCLVDLLGAD